VLTGHLSHQIEHHLFPDMPAWRYPEMAIEVQAICKKYGVPYHTGSFRKQLGSVMTQIAKLSLPISREDGLGWWKNVRKTRELKARGNAFLEGKNRAAQPAETQSALGAVASLPKKVAKRAAEGLRPAAA